MENFIFCAVTLENLLPNCYAPLFKFMDNIMSI